MLTDTAFLRNPHYHQASDTSAILDFDFMANVTVATAGAVVQIAAPERGDTRLRASDG